MSNVGYATLQVIPSLRGMDAEIRRQLAPLDQAGARAGDSMGRSFGGRFGGAIGGIVRGVGRVIETGLQTAGIVAGTTLAAALVKGFDRLTTIEDATAALTVSLGDATDATKLLDEVLSVVEGTPFNLDEFANAAQILAGMGVEADKIPPLLNAIGEVAVLQGGNMGQALFQIVDIFGTIQSQGKITGTEIRRFSQAGVDALTILANHFDVGREEMQKMISDGVVPADEAIDALMTGIVEGSEGAAGSTVALGGSMEALGDTLSGTLRRVGAALARLGESIIKVASPLAKAAMEGLIAGFDAIKDAIEDAGAAVSASDWMERLTDFFESVPDRIGGVVDRLRDFKEVLVPLAAGSLAAGLGAISTALGPLGVIVPRIHPLVGILAGIIAVSPELRDQLGQMAEKAIEFGRGLATELAPVAEQVGDALARFGGILLDSVERGFEAVMPLVGPAAELFATLLDVALDLLEPVADLALILVENLVPPLETLLEILTPLIERFGEGFGAALERVVEALDPVFVALAEALVEILERMAPHMPDLVEAFISLADAFADLMEQLVPILPPLIELAAIIIGLTAGGFLNHFTVGIEAAAIAMGVAASVVDRLSDAVGRVRDALMWLHRNVLVPIANFFRGAWNGAVEQARNAVDRFRDSIDAIRDALSRAWRAVFEPVANFFRSAWNNAMGIARGAADRLRGMLHRVRERLSDMWNRARSVASFFRGAFSSAAGIARGAWNGLRSVFRGVASALESIIDAARRVKSAIERIPSLPSFGDIASGIGGLIGSFHGGGIVPGPRGAEVPILAQGGEGVLSLADMAALRAAGSGGGSLVITGDGPGYEWIARGVRTGQLQLRANGQRVTVR